MSQQLRTDPALLAACANISVPNKGHVLHLLNAHYSHQRPALLVPPKNNALIDLMLQFFPGHVQFRPAILGDNTPVSSRAVVDNRPDQLKIALVTLPDHEFSLLLQRQKTTRSAPHYTARA